MPDAVSIIRQEGEGERMWFAGGGIFTWKASAEETGGAFLIIEDHMERGKTTPFHLHPGQDEAVYVLDGELLVHIEGENHRVGRGGLFVAPRGVPHAFKVTSEGAHILALMTPGSGESFYRAAGETVRSREDESRPPDWDRLRAAAQQDESIEILGPPPFGEVEARSASAGSHRA